MTYTPSRHTSAHSFTITGDFWTYTDAVAFYTFQSDGMRVLSDLELSSLTVDGVKLTRAAVCELIGASAVKHIEQIATDQAETSGGNFDRVYKGEW